jgi:hypothetical protein
LNKIYHRFPRHLQGDTLYPLNELKLLDPKLYAGECAKYRGREFLMARRVPFLDCLWNDVIHFSAVHPNALANALRFANLAFAATFLEFDPELLDPNKTVIFLNTRRRATPELIPEEFIRFNVGDLAKYSIVPSRYSSTVFRIYYSVEM